MGSREQPNHTPNDALSRREAEVFAWYLIKQRPAEVYVARYLHALRSQTGTPEAADKKLLAFAVRHPHLLAYIDAGLAVSRPTAELRRRVYVMFAILEASPEYCGAFLSRRRGPFYAPYAIFVAMRASWRAAVGLLALTIIG